MPKNACAHISAFDLLRNSKLTNTSSIWIENLPNTMKLLKGTRKIDYLDVMEEIIK